MSNLFLDLFHFVVDCNSGGVKFWSMTTNQSDIDRVKTLLQFFADNPGYRYPIGYVAEVQAEARELGLLPAIKNIGRHCRPGIDRGIIYGGDMVDVF